MRCSKAAYEVCLPAVRCHGPGAAGELEQSIEDIFKDCQLYCATHRIILSVCGASEIWSLIG